MRRKAAAAARATLRGVRFARTADLQLAIQKPSAIRTATVRNRVARSNAPCIERQAASARPGAWATGFFSPLPRRTRPEMRVRPWALWGLWLAVVNARSACFEDVLLCPDGEVRLRDPSLDCRFVPCGTRIPSPPSDGQLDPAFIRDCPLDFHLCEDGSLVERDPFDGCEFFDCTSSSSGSDAQSPDLPFADDATASSAPVDGDEARCSRDVLLCPGGFFVRRIQSRGCQFDACPTQIECPADAKHCPGDVVVHRNRTNDCNFDICPRGT